VQNIVKCQIILIITLVVQEEQSVRCVCLCVWSITDELEDLWPKYLAKWFILTLSQLSSKVKVIGLKFTVTAGITLLSGRCDIR